MYPRLFITSASLAAALLMLAQPAQAAEIRTGTTAAVAPDEVVDDDFFASGQTVTIAGRVSGDAFATGQTVVVSGTIDGDLLAAAQQVVVDGTVRGDVRAAGAQVTINGTVERSVTAAAQQVDVRTNGRVGGTVLAVGQSVGAFGPIGRSLLVAAASLQVAAPVGGEVRARVENLAVTPTARIAGDLDYGADREAELPAGAVAGAVRFVPNERDEREPAVLNGLFDLGGLMWLCGSAVLGVLFVVLAPRVAARTVHDGRRQPLPSLGFGLMAFIVVPLAAAIVAVTLIGIPLTIALLALYVLGLLVAWPAVSLVVGTTLADRLRRDRPLPALAALLVGLIVLHLATHVPFVGGLVAFLALAFGLGLVVQGVRRGLLAPAGSSYS